MSQNTSHAVMAQRHEAHDSLDHFPTPPWATRALCEWLERPVTPWTIPPLQTQDAWEPACAEWYMARALGEYFRSVYASDVHDYGYGAVEDFVFPLRQISADQADWIITNPPFRLAEQFATRALELASRGVALLVRTAFLESASRYETLFRDRPPSDILQFVERVPMQKAILNRNGSTATAYCWVVWRLGAKTWTRFHWLAPCRKRLERDSDYPPAGLAQ